MRSFYRSGLLAAVVASVALVACSSNPSGPDGANVDAAVRIATEGATVALLEKSSNPAVAAARVLEVIALVKTKLADNSTSVDDLNSALMQRIGQYNLDVGESLLAVELVNTVSGYTRARVGAGMLTPDAVTTVNKVLSYVELTASLYVSKSR